MAVTATDIVEEMTKLTAADGFSLEAFQASPKQPAKGGLVILQEIFGLTDQLKSVVRVSKDGLCLVDSTISMSGSNLR